MLHALKNGFTKRFNNWRNWVYKRGSMIITSNVPINSHKDSNKWEVNMCQQCGPESPQKTYNQTLLHTEWGSALLRGLLRPLKKKITLASDFQKISTSVFTYRCVSKSKPRSTKVLLESAKARSKSHSFTCISQHAISLQRPFTETQNKKKL